MTPSRISAGAIALAISVIASAPAHARVQSNLTFDNDGRVFNGGIEHARNITRTGVVARNHRGGGRHVRRGVVAVLKGKYTRHVRWHAERVSLNDVVGPLAAKGREIIDACGSSLVSAKNGRARRSNHPIGRAIDLNGNPSCIYAHLRGWAGGYSTDYATAPYIQHVHISYNPGGMEWGARFVHSGYSKTRYARRHRHHYARI